MSDTTSETTSKIRFSDGRLGTQTVDGEGQLTEVVVTQEADGRRCEHVYARRPDLRSKVYRFADLGPVTWEKA